MFGSPDGVTPDLKPVRTEQYSKVTALHPPSTRMREDWVTWHSKHSLVLLTRRTSGPDTVLIAAFVCFEKHDASARSAMSGTTAGYRQLESWSLHANADATALSIF
jgi:hypothetical protein